MEKTVRRFDMSCYATPKSEEDKRTLSEYGYRTLNGEEVLKCIKDSEGLTFGDLDIERVPILFLRGIIELRYYKEGAKDIENLKERGNSIWICFKDGGGKELFPIGLREEGK